MRNKHKNSSNCPSTALRQNLPPEQLSVKPSNNRLADFQVFPNPNDGNFSVTYQLLRDATLQITDLTGRIVKTTQLFADTQRQEIKASELNPGLYYLQVVSERDVLLHSQRIVIY